MQHQRWRIRAVSPTGQIQDTGWVERRADRLSVVSFEATAEAVFKVNRERLPGWDVELIWDDDAVEWPEFIKQ
jgi:hypothetical protein